MHRLLPLSPGLSRITLQAARKMEGNTGRAEDFLTPQTLLDHSSLVSDNILMREARPREPRSRGGGARLQQQLDIPLASPGQPHKGSTPQAKWRWDSEVTGSLATQPGHNERKLSLPQSPFHEHPNQVQNPLASESSFIQCPQKALTEGITPPHFTDEETKT